MADTDMRVKRTKKILKDSLKDILLKKEIEHITVKELCETSMINRRTFYLHYDTIYDLQAELLEDISLEFIEYTKGYDHFSDIDRIVRDYFTFTRSNPLYEKLNNNPELDYIREQLNDKVIHNFTYQSDSIKHLDDFRFNMTRIFLNSSTVSMYRYWYNHKNHISMDDAIQITADLIKNGLHHVTQSNLVD